MLASALITFGCVFEVRRGIEKQKLEALISIYSNQSSKKDANPDLKETNVTFDFNINIWIGCHSKIPSIKMENTKYLSKFLFE